MPTKLLLDTDIDIGGDIDDALCLAYLLAQPACDLLGITTVSWDTEKRARVASALCTATGRDVPIFPGAAAPLLAPLPTVEPRQPYDVDQAFLDRWDHQRSFPPGEAVEFMRRTIRAHPGQVVLLAIGPLTNVALLFASDPEIAGLLKGLVLMAGRFSHTVPGAEEREWNAQLDPHATAMVYRAAVSSHRSIGLDVTRQVTLQAAAVRARLHGLPLLQDMTEAWLAGADSVTFHDPLAAATIFDREICRFSSGAVTVELNDEQRRGSTYWAPGGHAAPHEVALQVAVEHFCEHYFATLALGSELA